MPQITLRLNNFLYNASIYGFIQVLKTMENDFLDVNYTIKGNTLTFSSDVFENFTEYYLKTLINKFEKDTNYIYCKIETDKVAKKIPQFCNYEFPTIAKGH
ncbi:hypothetical protein CSTERTH_09115 [Thermoclostridium stercorarium subsp. thermolacticum DSM 2910]|uniref:Uncharacterized protein n=1 Tax=Thermoclostridium stercorarium subsp. thermolacticum DSM 2910 TaxID=1121336 RepID=A0A1B1YEK4_THEST|nr:hypothetical protein [Thermoclostridium stercorarium]ANW99173.1 hypothetical protein CSTERTH_09115 [Thermoclostridium stercorarium subsp. thermolacticum DSM 2910]